MNTDDASEEAILFNRAASGDMDAWGGLLARHQERLLGVITFRLDPRLRARIDAADVVQETFIAATTRRNEFFEQSSQSLFLWLRWMVGNKVLELHRHHLDAKMRDARREHCSDRSANVNDARSATSSALIAQLTAGATGPLTGAVRAELHARLAQALDKMDPIDREVLALRHYEQLTNVEAAQVLGIQERAAAKRYTRALERLKEMLADTSATFA